MKFTTKLKLGGLVGSALLLVTVYQNFSSGLRLFDAYESDYETVPVSEEKEFLNSIRASEEEGGWSDEDYYGNFAFTKEDMETLFRAVLVANFDIDETEAYGEEFNSDVEQNGMYHKSRIYYQYYWETWCVYSFEWWDESVENCWMGEDGETHYSYGAYVPRKTELTSEYSEEDIHAEWDRPGHPAQNFEWGWHSGFRPTDSELEDEMTLFNRVGTSHLTPDMENHPYIEIDNAPLDGEDRDYTDEWNPRWMVEWQSVYALAFMASGTNTEDYEELPKDDGGIKISLRLDEGVLQKVIEILTPKDKIWGYKGAWASERSGYAQKIEYVQRWDEFGQEYQDPVTVTDYTRWDNARTGAVAYKWDQIDKISYTLEKVGDWGKTENGRTVYKRRLYKVPATSLLSVETGYESWTFYGKEVCAEDGTIQVPQAVVEGDRQKYAFYQRFVSDDGASMDGTYDSIACAYDAGPGPKYTNLNSEHSARCPSYACGGYQHTIAIDGGLYECDYLALEADMAGVAGEDWSWDKFINILETLPDSEEVVEKYEHIRAKCEEATAEGGSHDLYMSEEIPADQTRVHHEQWTAPTEEGQVIFIGKGDETSRSKLVGGQMVIPNISDDFDEADEVNKSLKGSLGLTVDDIKYLFGNYSGFLSRSNNPISNTDGVAETLVRIQNDYDVDILGLLAISQMETGFGTSDIAKLKLNFINWGAVDWNPREGAHDYSKKTVSDALYEQFSKICINYINKGQDTYYKMRYNGGTHQYCTSTTWPSKCAICRRQMMNVLNISWYGFSLDERNISNKLTDEENEELRNYVGTTFGVGELGAPVSLSNNVITSKFGPRKRPTKGASTNHKGVDIAPYGGRAGQPISAAWDGVVSLVADGSSTAGTYVEITHGENGQLKTRYLHMLDHSYAKYIKQGQVVKKGQIIGEMGSTGVGTGVHLHFEVLVNGVHKDPEIFLPPYGHS